MPPPIIAALMSAFLFGSSTPLAKQLIRDTSPLMLAGLLYMGSRIGLTMMRIVRDIGWKPSDLLANEWLCFFGVIFLVGSWGQLY